jgi:Ca-activated chloride channel family protein
VGLVVFAEGAFTYAPLTQDYAYLKRMIADLRPGMLPKQGTALGDAIAVAAMQLAETNSSGRAIVLLSDGAGNRGLLSSADAAQYALRQQIRTYALGIGLPTLPDTLADPAARGKLTALNLKALETLANVGGGLFLEATQPNALDQLLRHLATLPRTTLGSTPRPVIREVYPWPLGIALVALALAFLLQSLGLGNSLED